MLEGDFIDKELGDPEATLKASTGRIKALPLGPGLGVAIYPSYTKKLKCHYKTFSVWH